MDEGDEQSQGQEQPEAQVQEQAQPEPQPITPEKAEQIVRDGWKPGDPLLETAGTEAQPSPAQTDSQANGEHPDGGSAPVEERVIPPRPGMLPPPGMLPENLRPEDVGKETPPPLDTSPHPVSASDKGADGPQYLPQHVKDILSAYFDKDLLDKIQINQGIPAIAKKGAVKNPSGYTLGNSIYFAPGEYDPTTIDGIARIAHEITHSQQVARETLGLPEFAVKYGWDYAKGRLQGKDDYSAYQAIPAEHEAYDNQGRITNDLHWRFGDAIRFPISGQGGTQGNDPDSE